MRFMPRVVATLVVLSVLIVYGWGHIAPQWSPVKASADAVRTHTIPRDISQHWHPVYAPGTDPAYIARMEQRIHPEGENYNFIARWNFAVTAYSVGNNLQGDSLILTWSLVPDGTLIPGSGGEPECASDLFTVMDARYGAGNWQAEIAEVFEEWGEVTGNVYIYEPNDDGAAWPASRGLLGTRGDIRISGCPIDGDYNTLAYNFFPNTGDMKIDSTDAYYDSAAGALHLGFHYVVAHEIGHGVGLGHVCPVDGSKLMEPSVNTNFTSARHDDIRGGQRVYGDTLELPTNPNDDAERATDAGTLTQGESVSYLPLSLDDETDEDWIQFEVGAGSQLDIVVAPMGFTYQDGDIDSTGCVGPMINSLAIHNLDFEIRDSDGITVLASGNTSPAGINERLQNVLLGMAGTKYIRVYTHSATSDSQLYELTFNVEQAPITPTPTVSHTPTPTATAIPTATATIAPPTPTVTSTPTTVSPTNTPTPTPSPTITPTGRVLYLPLIHGAPE